MGPPIAVVPSLNSTPADRPDGGFLFFRKATAVPCEPFIL
jgi:hypothetical protein